MRKKVVASVMIMALVSFVSAHIYGADNEVTYGWTRVMGGAGGPAEEFGLGVAVDSSGNVYTTGYFGGTPDFGADFGTSDIKTSAGAYDIFITKIKPDGTYGWTRTIGGISADLGRDITTDTSDNIYVTGYFMDTVDFGADFGISDIKISAGSHDIFVMKIYADGTYGWTKTMGGIIADDGNGIAIDSSGSICVVGCFQETVDFGADFGTSDIKISAGWDAFFMKIYADGTYGWTKTFGGTGHVWGQGVSSDSSSNVYMSGSFSGIVNFGADFGASDSKTSAGIADIFVTKINAGGTYGWTKVMGGTQYESGLAIASDYSGNVCVTGSFQDTVNFGADFGTTDLKTSAGYRDIFVTKINANGTYGWTKIMGAAAPDGHGGSGIDIDSLGNIYLTGYFSQTVDFGADFGTSDIKTLAGRYDIFVTKIESNGAYGWTKTIGGTSYDSGQDIEIDTSGNIYLSGGFMPPVDFGLDFGTTDLKTFGWIFVTKLGKGTIDVDIDIRPTTYSNNVNPESKGNIPAAILTTDTFDAATVNPASVRFGKTGTEAAPVDWVFEDVDDDGDLDMTLRFKIQETGIQCSDEIALLKGKTYSDQPVEGSDSINTVGCI